MKKLLAAVLVIAVVGAAVLWSRRERDAEAVPGAGGGSHAAANSDAKAPPSAQLSAEDAAAARVARANDVAPSEPAKPAADAAPAAPVNAQPPSNELSDWFLEFAKNADRVALLDYQAKMRSTVELHAKTRLELGGARVTRTVFVPDANAEAWLVAVRNAPDGYVATAVATGYDKGRGGAGFDLYLFPADGEEEWASAQRELKWIDERLPHLP